MQRALYSLTLLILLLTGRLQADERPNVLFILADDLGWSDTTLYGTTTLYETPNIERLAARGMTFTRAYAASPLCSPTRASILTGLSPARIGITSPSCHLLQVRLEATPGNRAPPQFKAVPINSATRFDTRYHTLPEALKQAGYATGHFGKWHLGHEPYSPLEHGFDVDVPHWPGPGPAGSYVAPWKFPDFDPDTPNEHIEDRMAKEAVAFMQANRDRPFFLNYWMFSVHAPFDAKRELIEKYRGQVDSNNPQRSPTYAAMIESMDDAVGTLLDALDRLGLSERTIIVFASDNGGNMYNEVDGTTPTSNAPLRGGKATMYEGGVRGPCVVVWPGEVEAGSRSDQVIQSSDFYPTLLEMLQIPPRDGQTFDGISILPALEGKDLEREAIFTYFPHAPRVPDWQPPAVSVHRGYWKLIRLFHGGEDGAHRWKLFNLQDDPGETKDLAAAMPDRVQELDALIEHFLVETDAVRPTPNPQFDPAQYRPEDEGRPRPKRDPGRRAELPPAVAGWRAVKDCRLALKGEALQITSTGGDPHLSRQLARPLPAGEYRVEITMSSTARGRGQFFWQERGVKPAFFRDRSVVVDIMHDGESHTYTETFQAGHAITAIRLDPAQSAGEIRLRQLRLLDAEGAVVWTWEPGR
ncbi:Arylsulfatase precursor [Maioricimonas rarisocia]|uniref:Arylsulfatase n=1 Tax=Maioricimonas rarisocia TaxID=2528026 RepID=A0A517ZEG5_9PLAN|nr:sulfatase [Maioricimonas rarisocia]QDU40895.1 Arylsulfatase precursor [Maioricimonas rarisocia]